ncbi:TPM domain-containing protein [Leptothrix discophora]|uniref:TPM domain-containing protein n=1 Tax=Leptothrix discophora TaxID=89 RepID=A0ABT9G3I9_LEPDI|nr:TPM domain-containing protein [Leptothrix discophora]MDP4300827.1 TPM domain-containing protein [Leptothrix discophora]
MSANVLNRTVKSALRLLRHLLADPRRIERTLGPGVLDRLTARVQASEADHAGELRLCIEAGLPLSYLRRGASARERALMMFSKLRVWDTEANTGVLIYLLLADHAIEVVADRGLNPHVTPAQWQAIVDAMRPALAAGRFEDGLGAAIDAVDALLRKHCPRVAGQTDRNELSDRPDLR